MSDMRRKNHYVPQFYLKHWAVNDQICVYNNLVSNENVPLFQSKVSKSIAYLDNLYTDIRDLEETMKNSLRVITVAYTNCHDLANEGEQILQWSNKTNKRCHINGENFDILTGYIKNKAWAYEKEHRVMFDQENEYERASIDITEEILNAITLTPSPLFEGDFKEEILRQIERDFHIEQSLFYEKINIKTICSQCELKNT